MSRTVALMLALAVVTAGVLAAVSSGAANARRTIGLVLPDPNGGAPLSRAVEHGASAAASALGDDLVVIPTDGSEAMTSAVKSLIAKRAAAIIVSTDQGPDTVNQVLPVLARARAAGIPTLSYEQQFPGSLFVPQSAPAQYAQALADALATQMRGSRRYPGMTRVAVVYGDTGNGDADTNLVGKLIKRHPQLRGLINVCPGEAVILPQQVIQAHKVGKVFSAGNGALCPPVDMDYFARYVRLGAEEIVCAGDPVKLGYLVVWAADYLASGHTFVAGQYKVGGPVGTVSYDATDKELPLGQPLTITKANLAKYAGK